MLRNGVSIALDAVYKAKDCPYGWHKEKVAHFNKMASEIAGGDDFFDNLKYGWSLRDAQDIIKKVDVGEWLCSPTATNKSRRTHASEVRNIKWALNNVITGSGECCAGICLRCLVQGQPTIGDCDEEQHKE